MAGTSYTKPELQIMEVLWTKGACSIREIHAALPPRGKPAFTTVQTVVYRLEKKGALRCTKRRGPVKPPTNPSMPLSRNVGCIDEVGQPNGF